MVAKNGVQKWKSMTDEKKETLDRPLETYGKLWKNTMLKTNKRREKKVEQNLLERGMKREEQPGMMSLYTAAVTENASILTMLQSPNLVLTWTKMANIYLPCTPLQRWDIYGGYYIRLQNARGDTLLHVAARCGRIEVIEELLTDLTKLDDEERQADFQVLTASSKEGRIPLHEAILNDHTDVAMKLIQLQLGLPENKSTTQILFWFTHTFFWQLPP